MHESWPVVYLYSTSIQLQSEPNLSWLHDDNGSTHIYVIYSANATLRLAGFSWPIVGVEVLRLDSEAVGFTSGGFEAEWFVVLRVLVRRDAGFEGEPDRSSCQIWKSRELQLARWTLAPNGTLPYTDL